MIARAIWLVLAIMVLGVVLSFVLRLLLPFLIGAGVFFLIAEFGRLGTG